MLFLMLFLKKDFLKNVKQKGEYFQKGELNKIKKKYPKIIGEIRGMQV